MRYNQDPSLLKPSAPIMSSDLLSLISRPPFDGAKSGDYVECNLQELDESGVPIVGKKQEGRFLRLGEGYIKNDAEKALLGIKAEEYRNVVITMDDDSKVTYDIYSRKVQELIKPIDEIEFDGL